MHHPCDAPSPACSPTFSSSTSSSFSYMRSATAWLSVTCRGGGAKGHATQDHGVVRWPGQASDGTPPPRRLGLAADASWPPGRYAGSARPLSLHQPSHLGLVGVVAGRLTLTVCGDILLHHLPVGGAAGSSGRWAGGWAGAAPPAPLPMGQGPGLGPLGRRRRQRGACAAAGAPPSPPSTGWPSSGRRRPPGNWPLPCPGRRSPAVVEAAARLRSVRALRRGAAQRPRRASAALGAQRRVRQRQCQCQACAWRAVA